MNPDQLRAALADLSREVRDVDLVERTLRSSRRLKARRLLTGSAATVLLVALATGTALAVDGRRTGTPVAGDPSAGTPSEQPAQSGPPSPPPSQPSSRPASRQPTTPTSSARSTAATIPAAAMLRAADVGTGFRESDAAGDDHGAFGMMLSYCDQRPEAWNSRTFDLGYRRRSFTGGEDRYAMQETSRQPAGVAAALITELRTALSGPCETIAIGGNQNDVSRFTIVDTDVFGESSLLIREVRTNADGTRTDYRFAIRQGDLFTEVRTHVDGFTESQARDLATRAAERLCEATPTC